MSIQARLIALVAGAVLLPLGMHAAPALADPAADMPEICASAAERGQAARHAGRLLHARDELRVCGADICPAVVQQDCLRWLSEIDQELPSVIVRARDAEDRDVIGVRVHANGQLLVDGLDGRAIPLDPGQYELRYETRSGAVMEEAILLRLGEQRRD